MATRCSKAEVSSGFGSAGALPGAPSIERLIRTPPFGGFPYDPELSGVVV